MKKLNAVLKLIAIWFLSVMVLAFMLLFAAHFAVVGAKTRAKVLSLAAKVSILPGVPFIALNISKLFDPQSTPRQQGEAAGNLGSAITLLVALTILVVRSLTKGARPSTGKLKGE